MKKIILSFIPTIILYIFLSAALFFQFNLSLIQFPLRTYFGGCALNSSITSYCSNMAGVSTTFAWPFINYAYSIILFALIFLGVYFFKKLSESFRKIIFYIFIFLPLFIILPPWITAYSTASPPLINYYAIAYSLYIVASILIFRKANSTRQNLILGIVFLVLLWATVYFYKISLSPTTPTFFIDSLNQPHIVQ